VCCPNSFHVLSTRIAHRFASALIGEFTPLTLVHQAMIRQCQDNALSAIGQCSLGAIGALNFIARVFASTRAQNSQQHELAYSASSRQQGPEYKLAPTSLHRITVRIIGDRRTSSFSTSLLSRNRRDSPELDQVLPSGHVLQSCLLDRDCEPRVEGGILHSIFVGVSP
jgi:hypothetical protein